MSRCASRAKEHDAAGGAPIPRVYFGLSAPAAASSPNILRALQTSSVLLNGHSGSTGENERGLTGTAPTMNGASVALQREAQDDDALFYTNGARRTTRVNQWSDAQSGVTDEAEAHDALLATDPPREVNISPSSSTSSPPSSADASGAVPPVASATADAEMSDEAHTEKSADAHERHTPPVISAHHASSAQLAASSLSASSSSGWRTVDEKSQGAEPAGQGREAERAEALSTEKGQSADEIGAAPTDAQQHAALIAQQSTEVDNSVPAGMPTGQAPTSHRASSSLASSSSSSHPVEVHVLDTLAAGETDTSASSPSSASDEVDEEGNDEAAHSSGSVSALGDSTILRDPMLRVSPSTKVPAAASTARPAAEVDSAMVAAHASPVALATTDEPHRGRGEGHNDRQGDMRRDNRTRASAAFLDALSASSSSYDSGTESSQFDANVVPDSSPVAHGTEVVAVPSPQNESVDEAQQQRSSSQLSRMNAPAPPISSSPQSTTGALVRPGVSSPHDEGGHDDRGDRTSSPGAEGADAVQITHRERDSDEGEAYESLQPPSSVEFSQTPHSTPPTPTTLTHPRRTERFIGEDRAVEDSSPEELAEWSAMHASRSMGFSMPVVIPTGFGFSRSDTRNFVAPPSSQGTSPDTDATSATDQTVRRAAGLDDLRPHLPPSRSPSERPPLSASTRLSLSGRGGGGGGASAHTRPSLSHMPNSPPRPFTTPNISVPPLDERRNAGNAVVLSGPSLRREDFADVALYTVVLYQLYHQVAEQLDATCLYRLLRQIEPAGADAGQRLVLLRCCLEEVEGHERAVRALYGEHLIIPVEPCSMDTHSILTLQETLAFAHYILNMSTLPPAAAPATALITPPTGPDTRLVELESPPQAPRESVHKTGACTGAGAPHVCEHTTGPRSQPQTPTPPPFNAVASPGGLAVPVSVDDAPRVASASTKPPHPHPRIGRPAARDGRAKVSKLRLPVAMVSSAGGVGSGGSSGGCASSRSSSPFSSGSNALTSSLPAENEKATVWLQRAAPLLHTAFAELSEGEPSVPVVRLLRVLKEFQLRVDLEPFHGLKIDRELTGTLSARDFEWIIKAGLQVCASSESVFGPRFECILDAYATARYSSFRPTSLESSVIGAEQDNTEQSCNGLRAGRSGLLAGTPRTPLQSYINSLVNSPEMSRVVETGSDVEFPLIQANSAIALLFRLMRKAVQYHRRVQLADDQPSAAQPQGGPLTTTVRGGDTTVKPPLASDQPTPPTPSAHPSAQLAAPTAPRSAKGFRQSTPEKRGSRALRSSSGGTATADQNPRRARPMPPGAAAAAPTAGARRHRGRHATNSASGRSPTSHSRDRLASPGSAVRHPSPSKRPKCTHPTEATLVQQQGRQPRPLASRPASTRTPGQTPTYRHRDRRTSSVRSSPSSLGRAAGPRPARGSSDGKGQGTLSTRTETQVRPPSLASRPSAQRPPRRASAERRAPLLPHAPLPNTPPAMTQPILSMDWWLSFFQPPPPPQLSLDSAYAETPSSALRSLPVGAATSAVRASNRPGSRPSSGPCTPSFSSSLLTGPRDVYSSPSSRAREAQRVQRRDSMAAQHALRQRHRGQSPSTRSGPVDEDAAQNASRRAQRSPVSRRPLKRTSARDQHRRLRRSTPSTHVDKTHAQAVVAGPTTPAVASADAELLQRVNLLFSTRLQLIDTLVDLNARRNRTSSHAEEAALEADLSRLSAHLESTENELWRLLQRVPRGDGNDGAMRCPVEACDAAVMVNTADRIRPKEAAKPVPPLTAANRSVSADMRYSDDHNHSSNNNNNGSVTNSGQMPHHSAGGRRFSSSHPSPPWASSFATTVTTHAHDYPLVGGSRSTNEPSSYGGSSSSVNLYNGASLNAPVVSLGAAIDDAPPQFLRRGFASAMSSGGDLGIASHTSRDTAAAGEGGGGSSGSGSAPHSGSPTAMLYTEEKSAASTRVAPSTAMATTNVASLVNNNSNGFSSSRPKAVVNGSSRTDTESSHVQMAGTESGSSPVVAGASPFASLANSRALFALQQTSLGTMNMSGFTSWEMSPRAPSYFTYGSAGGTNSQTDVCRSLGDGSGQQARLWSAVRRAPNGFGGSYAAELASMNSRMHGVPNGGASGSVQNTPMRSLAGLSPASPRDWMSTASVTSASYLPSALASSLPISRILADHMQNMSVLTTSPGEANMSIPLDVIPERSWSDEASLQLEHLPGFSG